MIEDIGVDTVGLKIVVDDCVLQELKKTSMCTQRINKTDGELIFEYDNGGVNYSWGYNVLFKFTNEFWNYDDKTKTPYIDKGIPNIQFEFSVPKIICGNNLYSYGLSDVQTASDIVRIEFQKIFNVVLPLFKDWYIYRIDTCANYLLDGITQVRNYIEYLQKLSYPRREPLRYQTGIYFPSRTNTLKIYGKGPEFKKHDRKRLELFDKDNNLQLISDCILRVEIENKRKIKYEIEKYNENCIELNLEKIKTFGGYPKYYDLLEVIDMKNEFKRVLDILLCGCESNITDSLSAERKIRNIYSSRQAATFIAVYYTIVTQGEKFARLNYSRSIIQRARKSFQLCGISLIQSDLQKVQNKPDFGFPDDFSLNIENNPYYQKCAA